MASDKFFNITTPRGLAVWPNVYSEEVIKGKPTGKLTCGIEFRTKEDREAMDAEITRFIEETFPAKKAKAVGRPWKERDDKVFLKFATQAKAKDGTPKTVRIYDGKGRPVTKKVNFGNGSLIVIKGSLAPTEYEGKDYVKPYLNSIQIIKLVEFVPGGGFDAADDEDAWEADADDDDEAPAQEETTSRRPPTDVSSGAAF